jgi:hypothetical protein
MLANLVLQRTIPFLASLGRLLPLNTTTLGIQMGTSIPGNVRLRALFVALLTTLAACGATTGAGGTDGAAGAGGAVGAGATAGAGGAGGAMATIGACIQPLVGVVEPMNSVDVEWCDSGHSCATCAWQFVSAGGGSVIVPTSAPCTFSDLVCPGSSTDTDAGPASCTAQPLAASFAGVLVELGAQDTSWDGSTVALAPLGCLGRDNGNVWGDGSEPRFNGTACLFGDFRCVPACSSCL